MDRTVVLFALMLTACKGTDLPTGWESAERITKLMQSECAGDPYGPPTDRIELSARPGFVVIDYYDAHFRCEQSVEAFEKQTASGFEVLVQPEDMDPSDVAACDCLFDLSFETATDETGTQTVTVFRRWDNLNSANDPVLIGTSTVNIP